MVAFEMVFTETPTINASLIRKIAVPFRNLYIFNQFFCSIMSLAIISQDQLHYSPGSDMLSEGLQ